MPESLLLKSASSYKWTDLYHLDIICNYGETSDPTWLAMPGAIVLQGSFLYQVDSPTAATLQFPL